MDLIFPLNSRYWPLVRSRIKTVDVRVRLWSHDVKICWIYVSKPIAKFTGYFSIALKDIDKGNVNKMWARYRKKVGINHAEYINYVAKHDSVFIIPYTFLHVFKYPLNPKHIFETWNPNVGYKYDYHSKIKQYVKTNYPEELMTWNLKQPLEN